MEYGYLEFNIEKLLAENNISKNKFQRIDANLICKLCSYFDCDINEIITYVPAKNNNK